MKKKQPFFNKLEFPTRSDAWGELSKNQSTTVARRPGNPPRAFALSRFLSFGCWDPQRQTCFLASSRPLNSATGIPSGSDPRKTSDLIRTSRRRLNLVDLCKEEKVSRQRSPRRADNAVPVANQTEPQSNTPPRPRTQHFFYSFFFPYSVRKPRRLDRSFSNPARVVLKPFFPHVFLSRRDVGVSDGADCEREVTLPHHSHVSLVPKSFPHRAGKKAITLGEQLQTSTQSEQNGTFHRHQIIQNAPSPEVV